MDDVSLFTHENILRQLETATYELGYVLLKFYTENGKPVNKVTDTIDPFYLYPSGGTLRDKTFNIIFYDTRFDTNRGFKLPRVRTSPDEGSPK